MDGPILSAVAGYKGPGGGLLQSLCCRMKLVVSVPSYPVELETKVYRVAGLSCPEARGCKSAILRSFPNVFSLFGPCKVGAISFRFSWTTGMKKKFRYLILKKGQISGFAQIDIFLISNFLIICLQLSSKPSKCKKLGMF